MPRKTKADKKDKEPSEKKVSKSSKRIQKKVPSLRSVKSAILIESSVATESVLRKSRKQQDKVQSAKQSKKRKSQVRPSKSSNKQTDKPKEQVITLKKGQDGYTSVEPTQAKISDNVQTQRSRSKSELPSDQISKIAVMHNSYVTQRMETVQTSQKSQQSLNIKINKSQLPKTRIAKLVGKQNVQPVKVVSAPASKEKRVSPRFGMKESSKKTQSPKMSKAHSKRNDEEILFGETPKTGLSKTRDAVMTSGNSQSPVQGKLKVKYDKFPSQFIFKQSEVFDRELIHEDLKPKFDQAILKVREVIRENQRQMTRQASANSAKSGRSNSRMQSKMSQSKNIASKHKQIKEFFPSSKLADI